MMIALQSTSELWPLIQLAKLETCHRRQISELQQIVFEALPPEKKAYISLKSAKKLQHNLSAPNHGVGAFNEDAQLIGMAFLLAHLPKTMTNGLTACATVSKIMEGVDKAGVVCTVMVHPDFRKHKLMVRMLEALRAEAIKQEYSFVVAEVVKGNVASHTGFIHHGFKMVGADIDPSDNTPLVFLKDPLQKCPTQLKGLSYGQC